MRRPSARTLPNVFTPIRVASWSLDEAGGRVVTFADPGTPLVCQAAPTTTNWMPVALREEGVLYITLCFADDPQLRLRDTGTLAGRVGTLNVIGTRDQAGRGVFYEADCELRS
jgi:hypothetical protein